MRRLFAMGCNPTGSRSDFATHPLTGFCKAVCRRIIGLCEAGFDAVPGGFGGVPGIGQLLV